MRSVTVTGGTLFSIALDYLGDATQWILIAELNGVRDPWLSGLQTLQLPDTRNFTGGGVAEQ